jgi:hypothetical protein
LQTVAFLIHAQWSFFAINMHPNNIYWMNKGEMLLRKDTRTPMCACVCAHVCVRA